MVTHRRFTLRLCAIALLAVLMADVAWCANDALEGPAILVLHAAPFHAAATDSCGSCFCCAPALIVAVRFRVTFTISANNATTRAVILPVL